MTTTNAAYLRENGPAPAADLPAPVSPRDKRAGVTRLAPGADPRGEPAVDGATPVYHLLDHDRETVVRAFLRANPAVAETASRSALYRAFHARGPAWGDAIRRVTTSDEDPDAAAGPPTTGDRGGAVRRCDFCGTALLPDDYARHLEEACSAAGHP